MNATTEQITIDEARAQFTATTAELNQRTALLVALRSKLRLAREQGAVDLPWLTSDEKRQERELAEVTARHESLSLLLSADDLATIGRQFDDASRYLRTTLGRVVNQLPELDLSESFKAFVACQDLVRQHVGSRLEFDRLTIKAATSPHDSPVLARELVVDERLSQMLRLLKNASTTIRAIRDEAAALGML